MISSLTLNPRRLATLVIAGILAAAALAPADAGAIVPPRNCHIITVKDKRYNIKADQLRCRRARRYSRRYLRTRWRPRGYHCRRYQDSALRFRCARGIRVYYAIRR